MRTLKLANPPMHGPDVEAIQKLVSVPADGVYGVQTANAVYRAKVKLGYEKPDHSAGDLFVAYMTGRRKPTAAMAKRAHSAPKLGPGSSTSPASAQTPEQLMRAAVPKIWALLVANASKVHYPAGDRRTTSNIHTISTLADLEQILASPAGLTADCSQTASMVAHIAGAKCPDGEYAANWAADGYTGTMLAGSEHITQSQVQVGDFRVYGGGTGHHVAEVTAVLPNGDFEMGSHGGDPVHFILNSVEQTYQPAGGTWLGLRVA